MLGESPLSVTDASGRLVSLLNVDMHKVPEDPMDTQESSSKRKYHCSEPGCNKSFTTSGHLARHNRIHTGEKNFHCLFPGCQSRFSRQDNMMQHYRTHMSPKSRRSQKRGLEEARPRPRLHAHHRIKSDPVRVEQPLTIDQHLSNYHRSLLSHATHPPSPLTSVLARHSTSPSTAPPRASQMSPIANATTTSAPHHPHPHPVDRSPSTSNRTSRSNSSSGQSGYSDSDSPVSPRAASPTPSLTTPHLFYQHRPLAYTAPITRPSTSTGRPVFPSTLLHPEIPSSLQPERKNGSDATDDGASSGSLLQLAHIVSTFG